MNFKNFVAEGTGQKVWLVRRNDPSDNGWEALENTAVFLTEKACLKYLIKELLELDHHTMDEEMEKQIKAAKTIEQLYDVIGGTELPELIHMSETNVAG